MLTFPLNGVLSTVWAVNRVNKLRYSLVFCCYPLFNGLAELMAGVVGAGEGEEGGDACHIHDDHDPEGGQVTERIGEDAANEHTQTHADVT